MTRQYIFQTKASIEDEAMQQGVTAWSRVTLELMHQLYAAHEFWIVRMRKSNPNSNSSIVKPMDDQTSLKRIDQLNNYISSIIGLGELIKEKSSRNFLTEK